MSDAPDRRPVEPDATPASLDRGGAQVLAFPSVRTRPDDRTDRERPERPLREVLGDVLRDERLDQQRTLADVAREAAVSLPYLSEVERGRKDISSDLLAAICDALDLPLADVLERSVVRLRPQMRSGTCSVLLAA
jgi:DNA-binding Xre family transcriptional regulator